jgi:hypothetical protein
MYQRMMMIEKEKKWDMMQHGLVHQIIVRYYYALQIL